MDDPYHRQREKPGSQHDETPWIIVGESSTISLTNYNNSYVQRQNVCFIIIEFGQ